MYSLSLGLILYMKESDFVFFSGDIVYEGIITTTLLLGLLSLKPCPTERTELRLHCVNSKIQVSNHFVALWLSIH